MESEHGEPEGTPIESVEQLKTVLHKLKGEGEAKLVKENIRRLRTLRDGVFAVLLLPVGGMFALSFWLLLGTTALGYYCFVWGSALLLILRSFMSASGDEIKEMEADVADQDS